MGSLVVRGGIRVPRGGTLQGCVLGQVEAVSLVVHRGSRRGLGNLDR